MIFHVAPELDWKLQSSAPSYVPSAFETEGFVHCCTKSQVAGVLERYYCGQTGLLLLHLDESKLAHRLIYEEATNNELFPHVYGAINRAAVVSIEKIS
jgi:uncharacterized protein (DUF952 family)